jgi:hypothetical protein
MLTSKTSSVRCWARKKRRLAYRLGYRMFPEEGSVLFPNGYYGVNDPKINNPFRPCYMW